MRYFTKKDGSVFGKENPTKKQLEEYKKNGIKEVKKGSKKAAKKVKKTI